MLDYLRYWGKKSKTDDSHHLLVYHCLDVAAVAWHLLAPKTKQSKGLVVQSGLSAEQIRYLVVLLLMLHDLGKFSKKFQALVPELFTMLFPAAKKQAYDLRHDSMGFILWRGDGYGGFQGIISQIESKNRSLKMLLDYFVESGFGHHGIPPEKGQGSIPLRASVFFDKDDINAASSFVSDCIFLLGDIPAMPENTKQYKKILRTMSWQIAGLAILADWTGSNIEYFPYCSTEMSLAEYWCSRAIPQAEKAFESIRWLDTIPKSYGNISTIFPFIKTATPLQLLAQTIPLLSGPKLFIVEDVTGAGKTEAATVLASRIMANGDAEGLYIGLPTMATANAMYERMQYAYRRIFSDESNPSLILSHGSQHLLDRFTKTVSIAPQQLDKPYGEAEETATVFCNQWFADNRKKALLADVGVGTIDQALLGILPARHQSLRLLGLQRKVLIIDEVHAYDPYMKHLLEVLLEAHARGGGSAILLSATIPRKKHTDLIRAFWAGLDAEPDEMEQSKLDSSLDFPLLTQAGRERVILRYVETRKEVERSVTVNFLHSYTEVLSAITRKSAEEKCVCWIRNTVKDARKAFHDLVQRGIPVGKIDLFHSRFAMVDRMRIEEATIAHFGKKSGSEERNGRILIATQVVEQSLDLDFDEVFSDLAPIDLLIQRAGRLHRHIRDKHGNVITMPDSVDERQMPVLTLFCPVFSEDVDDSWLSDDFAGTAAVYDNIGVLWRTLRILHSKKGWAMPQDARCLIESVYGEENAYDVPPVFDAKVSMALGESSAKEGMAYLNALILEKGYCRESAKADQWNEEEKVPTRLSEDNEDIVLAVVENGRLEPYATVKQYAWDWSTLSVSVRDWEKTGYELASEYTEMAENAKQEYPRLKYSKFVVVSSRSDIALINNEKLSDFYDPRLGWGADLSKEE